MISDPGSRRGRLSRMRLSGWRKTAVVNTAVILVIFLALLACLAWSLHQTGGLNRILVLYDADCERSRQINLLLHLATNILSTIILASSNFFMQVLTSPSREELDQAHAKGRSLEIGVQSLMNFGQLRKRKFFSWFLFVLGSLPLHVFANSVIFGTDDGRSGYYAIYATESFVQEGQYFPLGAALTPDRRASWRDYLEPSSNMSMVIEKAAREAAGWERLDPDACAARYLDGMPLRDRQDVVMIVDSGGPINGWTTEELWNFNSTQEAAAAIYVPSTELNTLLSAQRGETNDVNSRPRFLSRKEGTSDLIVSLNSSNERLLYNIDFDIFGRKVEWGYTDTPFNNLLRSSAPTTFPVRYCLSETLASHCKVAVSVPVLLIVVITTLVKFSQCAFVLVTFRHENPLVTLGDAVESFLDRRDSWTQGCCTYGWRDFQSSGGHGRVVVREAANGARQWKKKKHRWYSAVPKWLQAVYYSVMFAVLGGAAGLYSMTDPSSSSEVFGPGPTNPLLAETHLPHGSVLLSSLIANAPQVVLSVCYLFYNSLFTRFLLAREWGSMSTAFHGLRVTEPKGQQTSTYWLQLPIFYAVPLMAVSALLHWLVSSCLYMMVGEGEWYNHIKNRTGAQTNGFADIPGAFIGVGYSALVLRIILIVVPVLLLIPILMSIFCRLPGNTTLVGSNSRAISAGCHGSSSSELEGLLQKDAWRAEAVPTDENVNDRLSGRKLKWGVVGSGVSSHRGLGPDGLRVEHLTLQSEEVGVSEPVDCRWYA